MTPELPSDPPLRTLELDGHRVAYTDEGEGPVLVAVHGLPGSLRDFRWLAPALTGVRFIRLDLPGFGDTPLALEPSPHVPPRARLVLRVLDALKVDRMVLLGHSFGGPIAIEAAAQAGSRAAGLALLASVGLRTHRGKRQFPFWRALSLGFRVPPVRWALLPKLREAYVRSGFPRSIPEDALINTLHRVAFTDIPRNAASIRALKIPTLVSWAQDDTLVEHAVSQELADAAFEGPRLSFPDGGHNIQKTKGVELGEALSGFVQSLG